MKKSGLCIIQTTKRKCIKFALIIFYIMTLKKLNTLTDLSLSGDRSFVANNPAAESANCASTDVGGMGNKALNNFFNLLGLFPVASSIIVSFLA